MTMLEAAYLGANQQSKVYLGDQLIIGSEPVDHLALAPVEHRPMIACAPLSQWSEPTIAGSDGWWREKRADYAETPMGDPQSATTRLDVGGSSYFAYPCMPGAVAHPANEAGFVYTEFKPGGDSQNARWLFNLRFVTESPTVELRFRSSVANPDLGLVLVNGQRIQERTVTQTLGEAGVGYSTTLTFPDSRTREITIYGLNHVAGNFGGVAVEPGYTVAKPLTQSTKRVAIIGDSYVNGHNTVSSTETFAWKLALAMGSDCIIQAGIGGTGFDTGTNRFGSRLNDVLGMMPDVIILAGGRNDSPGVQMSVDAALRLLQRDGFAEIFVMPTASESTQAEVRDEIRAACGSTGVVYLDVGIDSLDKIADGIHPTWEAHQTLADDALSHMGDPPPPPPPPSLVTATVNRYTTASTVGTSWYPSYASYPADTLLLAAQWASGSAHPLAAPEEWTELGVHTRSGMSAGVWTRMVGTDYSDTDVTAQASRIHALAQYRFAHTAAITLGAVSDQESGQFFTMPSYTATPGAVRMHLLCVASSGLDAVSMIPPGNLTVLRDDLPGASNQMGFMIGAATNWQPDVAVGTVWEADDTSHFGIKWALELTPAGDPVGLTPVTEYTFDTGVDGWTPQYSSGTVAWGDGALEVVSTGSGGGVMVRNPTEAWYVSPWQTLSGSFRVRVASGQVPTSVIIRPVLDGIQTTLDHPWGATDPDGWFTATWELPVPEGFAPGDSAFLRLGVTRPAAQAGDVYEIDDVQVSVS